tara:strand:- start:30 stop:227 length:198 start_codon:yes stop_codon:yes gene_type:complete
MNAIRTYYVDSFVELQDAEVYLETALGYFEQSEMEILEASINYVNKKWRSAALGERLIEEDITND